MFDYPINWRPICPKEKLKIFNRFQLPAYKIHCTKSTDCLKISVWLKVIAFSYKFLENLPYIHSVLVELFAFMWKSQLVSQFFISHTGNHLGFSLWTAHRQRSSKTELVSTIWNRNNRCFLWTVCASLSFLFLRFFFFSSFSSFFSYFFFFFFFHFVFLASLLLSSVLWFF